MNIGGLQRIKNIMPKSPDVPSPGGEEQKPRPEDMDSMAISAELQELQKSGADLPQRWIFYDIDQQRDLLRRFREGLRQE